MINTYNANTMACLEFFLVLHLLYFLESDRVADAAKPVADHVFQGLVEIPSGVFCLPQLPDMPDRRHESVLHIILRRFPADPQVTGIVEQCPIMVLIQSAEEVPFFLHERAFTVYPHDRHSSTVLSERGSDFSLWYI